MPETRKRERRSGREREKKRGGREGGREGRREGKKLVIVASGDIKGHIPYKIFIVI